jgi:hypothetical protein
VTIQDKSLHQIYYILSIKLPDHKVVVMQVLRFSYWSGPEIPTMIKSWDSHSDQVLCFPSWSGSDHEVFIPVRSWDFHPGPSINWEYRLKCKFMNSYNTRFMRHKCLKFYWLRKYENIYSYTENFICTKILFLKLAEFKI